MLGFFIFIYGFISFFTIACTSNQNLRLVVNPMGQVFGPGPPILVRKVDDSLNLTCRLVDHRHETLPNYNISWNWQYSMGSNANRVMVVSLSHNEANLVFESLKETDSGEYTCKCTELDLHENVRVKVKAFKKYCSDKMFVCPTGHCIGRNFVCDGKPDCKYGADEAYEYCGLNPCEGKIPCDNGRCIPTSWCCNEEHDPNCTIKFKPRCCQQLLRTFTDSDTTSYDPQISDMGFLQTTIYTVIGCAMAFMFIVTILVIAICRVHLKRSVISRCPLNHQHLRPGSPFRPALPLYDIDMFLDRHQDSHSGGLLVTYNINNGVQFVGRPIDPPPYCEIVDTPPREGPPPPYVSREDLSRNHVEDLARGQINGDLPRGSVTVEGGQEGGDRDTGGGGGNSSSKRGSGGTGSNLARNSAGANLSGGNDVSESCLGEGSLVASSATGRNGTEANLGASISAENSLIGDNPVGTSGTGRNNTPRANIAGSSVVGRSGSGSNLGGHNLVGANGSGRTTSWSNPLGGPLIGNSPGATGGNFIGNNLLGSSLPGGNASGGITVSNHLGRNGSGGNLVASSLPGGNLHARTAAGGTTGGRNLLGSSLAGLDESTEEDRPKDQLISTADSDGESTKSEMRMTHVPQEVVSSLKGLSKLPLPKYDLYSDDVGLITLFGDSTLDLDVPTDFRPQCASSLGDVSKFSVDSSKFAPENFGSYEFSTEGSKFENPSPSVSGFNKIRNKNIKRSVFTDFSDSESDSSCMENDALLNSNQSGKNSDNNDKFKSRSTILSHSGDSHPNSSSNSFINNIAAVSKSLIGSLSKRQPVEPELKFKNEKFSRGVSPNSSSSRKPLKPLLTQKSFDSSERCRKDIVSNNSNSNFDKVVPSVTHSMGDLSPVNSDVNYGDFDRRDFLTLPLRESFIGVRNEEV